MTEPVYDYLTFNFDDPTQVEHTVLLNASMFSSFQFGKNIKLKVLQYSVLHADGIKTNPCALYLKNALIRNAYCNNSPDVFLASEYSDHNPEYRIGSLPRQLEFSLINFHSGLSSGLKISICVAISYYDEPVVYNDKFIKRID
jgi:hypothetical protein